MTKDWVHGVGHSPVCQILLQIVVRAVITSSPPAWTSSAGMLSTPADFPFFNDCTAASTSLRRMGWPISVCLGTVQYWWISIGFVVVQLRAVFSPSVQYLSLFCEAFSLTILDSSCFPLFHSGQVFHQLVCPLTVVLPKIFFYLLKLFSCTSWCCCSLPCISQILQAQIFSFSVLSFCRTDQEFLHINNIDHVQTFLVWNTHDCPLDFFKGFGVCVFIFPRESKYLFKEYPEKQLILA